MNTIQQQLKSRANNGQINANDAAKIAAPYDNEREATISLLKKCEQNVGMMLGEEINAHIAQMQGSYFNARDYHYERPVGEQ